VIQNFGIRRMEAFIIALVATIGLCFAIEIFLSDPDWGGVVGGLVPKLSGESLYVAIGILGATVMPHNLYLHSALVQTRSVEPSPEGKRQACRMNFIDTGIALNGALFVNAAILVVSAAVFHENGIIVTEIQQAHELLEPLLGTAVASTLFAVALIAAGQSSTLTGTLAGQIVMEGFLRFRMRPWVRRLITRMIAIIPAVLVISIKGEEGTYGLLILSQVILSLQLPFAIIPLIRITSDRSVMGDFANRAWVKVLAWTTAVIVVGLNGRLLYGALSGWIGGAGPDAFWIWVTAVPAVVATCLLLVYISLPMSLLRRKSAVPVVKSFDLSAARYAKIGVAVDYSDLDSKVLAHAFTLARGHGAPLFLFHVVEGVSGQLFGKDAGDEEARKDLERLEGMAAELRAGGAKTTPALGFGSIPDELIRLSREHGIDILVMGGHRHRGLKDVLHGASISKVRHALPIPVLIIQ
jgi:manganese transport protein